MYVKEERDIIIMAEFSHGKEIPKNRKASWGS